MSYKHDVLILLKEDSYQELKEKIRTGDFYPMEIENFRRGTIYHHDNEFVSLNWNYTNWDAAIDELVEMIEDYLKMLNMNNIPFRYITVGELDEISDIYNYGKNPSDIAYIASVHPITKIWNGLKIKG